VANGHQDTEKAYNVLTVLAQREMPYEFGQRQVRTKLSTKPLSRGADQICVHETTDEKLNAGRKTIPAPEPQQVTTAGPGDVAVI